MASRKALIGTLCLACVAAVTYLGSKAANKNQGDQLKKPVLGAVDPAEINLIELNKGDQNLKIMRGSDNVWYLGDATSGKAVLANQVVQLIDDLSRIRIDQIVGTDKDGLADYGLITPTVVSVSANDKVITRVNFGTQRSGGGQYLSLPDDSAVYLSGGLLQVNMSTDSWLAPDSTHASAEATQAPAKVDR